MHNDSKKEWLEVEKKVISVFKKEVSLMTDLSMSVIEDYHPKKLYPFRELCLGYLLIANNNAKAALRLIKANLVHQIHYISRNMFEMVVTLYYIDDDKLKKEELINRYFAFNSSIVPYKAMISMKEYPAPFEGIRTDKRDEEIIEGRKEFIKRYGKETQTWSGKGLPDMIKTISDLETRNDLLKRYSLMVQMNNNFLHPTMQHFKSAKRDFVSKEVDYKIRVTQLHSVSTSADLIIRKFLESFQKGRPDFRERLDEINESYSSIMKSSTAM